MVNEYEVLNTMYFSYPLRMSCCYRSCEKNPGLSSCREGGRELLDNDELQVRFKARTYMKELGPLFP